MTEALIRARIEFLSTLNRVVGNFIQLLDTASKEGKTMALEDTAEDTESKNALRAPMVVLSNGLKIANFCDEDVIMFADGNILQGCEFKRVKALAPKHKVATKNGKKGTIDIYTMYDSSSAILDEVKTLEGRNDIDIVIVPVQVMEALKEWGYNVEASKVRTRCYDKITQTVRVDQFGNGLKKVVEPESV